MASARQPIEIVLRQSSAEECAPASYSVNQLWVKELIDDADVSLFSQLMNSKNHIVHQLLPERLNPYGAGVSLN